MDMQSKILNWLATGQTGESSKTIAFRMLGGTHYKHESHPYDPDDFNRCFKLLVVVPEIRPRLREMAAVSPSWSALVDHWDEIEQSFLEETAIGHRCPKTYKIMDRVLSLAAKKESA